MILYFWQTFKW